MRGQVCYGGTFDPVHNGHLAIACAVREALAADVRLLPAADPPHKGPTHADAARRARMLDLAIAGERGVSVDRRELMRDGPSYTIDTLRDLRSELGTRVPIVWLVGSDSLAELHTWHRWRELFDYAHVLAVKRPGSHVDAVEIERRAPEVHAEVYPRWRDPEEFQGSPAGAFGVFELAQPRPESSTELRRRIALGEPWQDWVPPAVAEYIGRHQLYAGRPAPSAPL
jgi:nicotinate-nucleotide adenylyltransferase